MDTPYLCEHIRMELAWKMVVLSDVLGKRWAWHNGADSGVLMYKATYLHRINTP